MAPLCADPRQLVIALDPPGRRALLQLVTDIAAHMVAQLAAPAAQLGSVAPDDLDQPAPASDDARRPSRQEEPPPSGAAARQAKCIQNAARQHMTAWRDEFLPKLEELVAVPDSTEILAERQARRDTLANKETPAAAADDDDGDDDESEDVPSLQALYGPLPTPLANLSPEDRREALVCVLLVLLLTGKYSAHSRTLVLYLASALHLPQAFVNREEAEIARTLLESASDAGRREAMAAEAEAEAARRRQQNRFSRFWKVGLASVAGAAIVGVTGGLAAPLVAGALGGIMGAVGLGGVASFLAVFWTNGALVGALFGAYGAKMTGEMMDSYAREVDDFCFLPLGDDDNERRLRVVVGVNGWLASEDDVIKPWRVLGGDSEVFALRYEMQTLLALGTALQDLAQSAAWKALKAELVKRSVLATLWAALWPIQVLGAAASIDNPFSRARNRSRKAGQLLADALIRRVQGERPVTLVGYSLGAAAVHACLQTLAERHAFGLVDAVVLVGAPAPAAPAHWRTLRAVVSGRLFNVYSENDMVLGLVYRMHSLTFGVAGLQPVTGVDGLVNVDLSARVSGHLRYPLLMGEILRRCGFVGVDAGSDIAKDDVIRSKDDHRPDAPSERAAAQEHTDVKPDSKRPSAPDSSSSDESAEGDYAESALEDEFCD